MALTLASQFGNKRQTALRRKLIGIAFDDLQSATASVEEWIAKHFDARTWSGDRNLAEYRGLSWSLAGQVFDLGHKAGAEALQADPDLRGWLAAECRWL